VVSDVSKNNSSNEGDFYNKMLVGERYL